MFNETDAPQPPKVLNTPLEIAANLRQLMESHDPLIITFHERSQRFQSYVVHVFNLEGDLEEVNRRMGNMGPVIPEWVGMAHEMGQKAELLVVEGLWGWTKDSPGPEHWRWVHRELYMYLKGVGWVSWRWQEHEDGDLSKPFITEKMGNMDRIVWERPGEFVRNVELCEPVN